MNKAIVVIGGGAGGMMAAICAARKGAHVTLLDPNERLGKKVNITGKGRCNVTNDSTCEELLAHVPQNPRFLYSVFSRFDGHDAIDFFEGLGVPLKVERGKRVFPVSDRSFDITAALERELKRLHVKLVRDRALGISVEDGLSPPSRAKKGTTPPPPSFWRRAGCPIPRRARRATASAWRKRSATQSRRCAAHSCRSRHANARCCKG